MDLKDFFQGIKDECSTVLKSDFEVEIIETDFVPSFDDNSITYDNLDTKKKKCKRLESCVLFVDIRNSAKFSASKQPHTLSKIYSVFVRTMIACARYYGGHIRNIIGDRVMVVFDKENCFKNAIDTAILMNTVSQYILNKKITATDFKCGIGIDYGNMLITKTGAIKQGSEKEFYRGLVWLGKPANVASRLTDLAYKTIYHQQSIISQGNHYPLTDKWSWFDTSYDEFLDNLKPTYNNRMLQHQDEYFCSFHKSSKVSKTEHSPILLTDAVYQGLKRHHPNYGSIKKDHFKKQNIQVRDYSGIIYGGDVYFSTVKEL
ncbi:MAG: adenylate/guanylate cyclase domain-containing protein [Legionellaceae bacterium]|nr:adenylate/guanylate cyclase domain-containing protein [Legionellaceae bacterium]